MSQLRPPISLSTHRPVSSPFSWSYIVSHTPLLPLFHPPETHTHTHHVPSLPLLSASVKQQSLLRPGGLTCVYPWSERWFGGGRAEAVRAHQCAAPIVFGFSELCGSGRLRVWERWYEPRWALCCAREHHELRNASPDEPALQRHLWEPRLL